MDSLRKSARCVIIHGCSDSKNKDDRSRVYKKHWVPWLRLELKKARISSASPVLQDRWAPDYDKWKKEFEKYKITKKTILIGHSCGCAFLVRWLGDTKSAAEKLILVAPSKISSAKGNVEAKARLYDYKIDRKIRSKVKKIVIFASDDDTANIKKSVGIYSKALGAKVIWLHGKGHFVLSDMGTPEFPELLREVLSK